jgi:hypothetical protein
LTEKHFTFTDLRAHQDLLEDITRLENKMKSELGRDVSLVAYSPKHGNPSPNPDTTTHCRAGLGD